VLGVSIIGGYLGAGKTTLVNNLLRNANGTKLAVLVNEFGALPIDEDLIEAQDDALISIAGGCVCCSYGNDLIQSMLDLSKLDPSPDHILIEASGVALPGAIAATVAVLDGFEIDGIVVLTDAETIRDQARNEYIGDTIERQLSDANLVLLNKVDLVTATQLEDLQVWLKDAASHASVIECTQGSVPNEIIFQSFEPRTEPANANHHPALFDSKVLHLNDACDADHIAETLASAVLGLVRAKGCVPTSSGLKAIQIVGRRWSVTDAPQSAQTGVVVIAQAGKLDLQLIEQELRKS
jgi:G3E family GTPase